MVYKRGDKKQSNFSKNKDILKKHEKIMKEFNDREKNISNINTKISTLNKKIHTVKMRNAKNRVNSDEYDPLFENKLITDLKKLECEKNNIKNETDMTTYLLESSQMLSDYIQLEERETELLNSGECMDELNDIIARKNVITDKYLTAFDKNYIPNTKFDDAGNVCDNCGVIYEYHSEFLVCPKCGKCVQNIDQVDLSYKELHDYEYKHQFQYDKISHLEDWLKRFQSRENRVIPDEILDKIRGEIKKERITDLSVLTEEKVKKYLKKLGLNDYYDNVIGIINRINGRKPFVLTPEVEQKIKYIFKEIQEPYEMFKPPTRKNFLSYSYCLHHICKILQLHEFSEYFPLLKSIDKLRVQDEIFEKIVNYMKERDSTVNWVFEPSI